MFSEFVMKKEWETDFGKFKAGDNFCQFISPLDDPIEDNPNEKPGDPIRGTEFECPGKIFYHHARTRVRHGPWVVARRENKDKLIIVSAENRKVCMWDKNNVGCCTDNLDLAHSWHDTGCIGKCTWNNINTLEIVAKRSVPFNPSVIYALSNSPGIRNQFNFECSTHKPATGLKIHWILMRKL